MSKLNNTPQYDAGDMLDLASLAHEKFEWLCVGLADIRKELARVKEELAQRDESNGYQFYILEKKIEIFEHLSQDHQAVFDKEIATYTAEWKGGEA